MVAVVGSGGLALFLMFVLEIFDTRLKSTQDIERHVRIRVLGVVPQVKQVNGGMPLLLSGGVPTQFAELFRGLRTNVVMAPEFANERMVLVTSSEPGEGKTVTAANLAVSLARLHQRVLLIDADLRRPRLHELFDAEQQPGLTDALAGTAVSGVCSKTNVPGMWLMPSGRASHNPADLLGSDRFAKLMHLLQGHFDWIVLDSPPVLAVTDSCLIARVVSGVLFVVASGQTSPQVAAAAVERLDAAGGVLVGAMLNRALLDQPGDWYLPDHHQNYKTYYAHPEDSGMLDLPAALPGSESHGNVASPAARG